MIDNNSYIQTEYVKQYKKARGVEPGKTARQYFSECVEIPMNKKLKVKLKREKNGN